MNTILAIKLTERNNDSVKFQKILTEHGCQIRTRIGLHSGTGEVCTPAGIILLDVTGDPAALTDKLKQFWDVKSIEFN